MTNTFADQMKQASGHPGSSNHGSHGSHGSYPGVSVQSFPKKPDHMIRVLEEDGTLYKKFKVPVTYSEWLPIALKFYPPGDMTSDEWNVLVPKARCKFEYGQPKFNTCTYVATDDYLQARWGRKLHATDREWLAAHPFATDDGIPTEYTLICLQQLLEPYGMGISAVRVRKGLLAAGGSMMQIANALGINPLGLVDHTTDNAEAAKQLGMELDQAKKLWRFEFSDEPLPGCTIVCERGATSTSEYSTGFAGGHAKYLAPRDRYPTQWVLSIQIAPLEMITYQTDIVLPEYVARKGEETLILDHVLRPDVDIPIATKQNNWYKEVRVCVLCGDHKGTMKAKADCCEACYEKAWSKYRCPKCNTKFGKKNRPWFDERSHAAGFTKYSCSKQQCDGTFQVWDDDTEHAGLVAVSKTFEDTVTVVKSGAGNSSSAITPPASAEDDEQNFMFE